MAKKKMTRTQQAYAAMCEDANGYFKKKPVNNTKTDTGIKVFNPKTGKVEPMRK